MKENIFNLDKGQLKEIALTFKQRMENGLAKENTEIQCLPTFVSPRTTEVGGQALVLDLGGTNYRAAVVEFKDGKPQIHPEDGWTKDLSVMKTEGFTREELFKEQSDLISEVNIDKDMPIGYCFSYPASSLPDGDAILLRWTKHVDIQEMIGQPVGKPLMKYLNRLHHSRFTSIKVINDTVASLFAGLMHTGYDAYLGLIVGTGTNLATFVDSGNIAKLGSSFDAGNAIPVNLESGNFVPPFLTSIDDKVDSLSANRGHQRFEKAVSGLYLGEILKAVFPFDEFEPGFDARKLTYMLSYPDIYKEEYVQVARWIYERSAKLVAASIAGMLLVLIEQGKTINRVRLTAEGSLFWSNDLRGRNYKELMLSCLHTMLEEFGYGYIEIDVEKMENANLIGSAIAALA